MNLIQSNYSRFDFDTFYEKHGGDAHERIDEHKIQSLLDIHKGIEPI